MKIKDLLGGPDIMTVGYCTNHVSTFPCHQPSNWRFPEIGVPPIFIHFRIFHAINHPAIGVLIHDYLYIYIYMESLPFANDVETAQGVFEAVKLMKVGAKGRAICPPKVSYSEGKAEAGEGLWEETPAGRRENPGANVFFGGARGSFIEGLKILNEIYEIIHVNDCERDWPIGSQTAIKIQAYIGIGTVEQSPGMTRLDLN